MNLKTQILKEKVRWKLDNPLQMTSIQIYIHHHNDLLESSIYESGENYSREMLSNFSSIIQINENICQTTTPLILIQRCVL